MTTNIHDWFEEGDRVRVRADASFKRDHIGYITRIEKTGRVWVMVEGCLTALYFDERELEHAPLPAKPSRMTRLIDFIFQVKK